MRDNTIFEQVAERVELLPELPKSECSITLCNWPICYLLVFASMRMHTELGQKLLVQLIQL